MDLLVDIERLHLSQHRPRGPVRPPSAEVRQWIDEQGLLLPILVRRLNTIDPAEYEIVSGESYWKAAQELQIYRVPVLVRNELSDDDVRTALKLERAGGRRSDPIAEARAIAELKNAGMTDQDIGERVGMPRHQVTQARRLLNLIEPVQAALIGGQISVGHARVLASLDEAEPGAAASRRHDQTLVGATDRSACQCDTGPAGVGEGARPPIRSPTTRSERRRDPPDSNKTYRRPWGARCPSSFTPMAVVGW